MKKSALLLWAVMPFSVGQLDLPKFEARAFDPRVDNPQKLAQGSVMDRNMNHIAAVTSAHIPGKTWSGHRWDDYTALLGERYTDSHFTSLHGWPSKKNYNQQYPAEGAISSGNQAWIAALSPAEKYDVIMGTIHGGFYDQMAAILDRDMDSSGNFPTWWGICEGGAAASISVPEPLRTVVVHSQAYDVDVPFYASDIKGLAAMVWSSYNKAVRLPEMGLQCDEAGKIDQIDGQDEACYDNNPGSMMVVLNHFLGQGTQNGSLIIDTDATKVVWNHPVTGYDMQFFRPGSGGQTTTFGNAVLARQFAGNDPRARMRAAGTAYIVGVQMNLYYAEDQRVVAASGSTPRIERTMPLTFELELDQSMNVLGGEWLVKRHPDLSWMIPPGMQPSTFGDRMLGGSTWDGVNAPANWADAARKAGPVPLWKIVDGLVRRSAI